MINIKEAVISLSNSVCIAHIDETVTLVEKMLGDGVEKKRLYGNALSAFIKGKTDRTLLIEAHTDEIGFIVTDVRNDGFVKVACAGGFDIRALPSHRVIIHGKEDIPAVFTSVPPHLSSGDTEFDDISKLSLDTGLGEKAGELISAGDLATYDKRACELCGNRVTGKSLDNRAGVAALLCLAKKFEKEQPPINVLLLFCGAEELGHRGAKTAAFSCECDEAIAVDVSFAAFPEISPEECGKLGHGPMIGISPVLSSAVARKLTETAKIGNIPYQVEVMGGTTATDADVLSVTKEGIPTGLLSIPLRNMHTDAEVIDTADIASTADLLYAYIMSGGAVC